MTSGPVTERLAAHAAEIGGGLVIRRLLPHRQRRTVGAWCFLDHAGPLDHPAGGGLRVGPHPHIGLQTFTWMIEGAVTHRDSLGNEQVIRPGQVNLMTAGRGIAHSEDSVSDRAGRLHAVQLWIALPDADRHCAPTFHHHAELPLIVRDGFEVRVLAGSACERTSPAAVHSPLVGLELAAAHAAVIGLPLAGTFEHAVLTVSGAARVGGEMLEPGMLLYLGTGRTRLDIDCQAPVRIILIGGEPFAEEVLLWWNFVARTVRELEDAAREWNQGVRFGVVSGSPSPRLVAPDPGGLRPRPRPTQA